MYYTISVERDREIPRRKKSMKLEEARSEAKRALEGKTWRKDVNYCFIMKFSDGDHNIAYSWDERKYAEELGWEFVESLENEPTAK